MKYDPKIHQRHSIRLQGYDYSQAGAYYVTIVTYGRECLFGDIKNGEMQLSAMGCIAHENWQTIPEHFRQVELGEFIIMSNHLHGIIIVGATQWVALTRIATTPVDSIEVVPALVDPTRIALIPIFLANTKSHGPKRGSIGAIIGAYKMSVTPRIKVDCNGANIWQRNYYEHIIRNNDDHARIQFYIESNPINWAEDKENPEKKY
jgi:putative transposase